MWDAKAMAEGLMREHGLLPRWSFGFNQRKRTLGLCDYGKKRIELSVHLVHGNDEEAVRDTLLHEIAHAIAGAKAGHGEKWKRVCIEIGARPERCDRSASMPKGKWMASCAGCGHEHTRHRRPLKGRTYYCRECGARAGELVFRRDGGEKLKASQG
ncbi:SprT family zinc-dependent metalloprotease [Poriferisphaera corsica]|nr:SprT-like domain-containing protein [Poriferisphaera corsica]